MTTPNLRVLCVDDEPDLLDVVRMALELSGDVVVETCGSGKEAPARAAAFRPDVLLIDVMMPGVDGPTTLATLRRTPGVEAVPAMFFTAKAELSELDRLRSLGAAGVIVKPFDPLTLEQRVRTVLAGCRES